MQIPIPGARIRLTLEEYANMASRGNSETQTGRTTRDFSDPSPIINCQSLSITCFEQRFPEAQPRRGLTFGTVSASDLTPEAEEPSGLILTAKKICRALIRCFL